MVTLDRIEQKLTELLCKITKYGFKVKYLPDIPQALFPEVPNLTAQACLLAERCIIEVHSVDLFTL